MALSAYIVDVVRTAGGKKGGKISHIHPADLGGHVINALLERTSINPASVDDVIFGCVSQVGVQATNVARNAILSSKLPISVPGTTVDRQCGSGQQAIHFAAQAVMSGSQDVVIAGGVEVMSMAGLGSSLKGGNPTGKTMQERWPGIVFSQFEGAEIVAQKHGITREEMESMAVLSHERGHNATKNGHFKNEIAPITVTDPKTGATFVHEHDEGIRYPASKEAMAKLKPLKEGGRVTAATSSQICDGASAVLICNEKGLQKLGLKPRAKIIGMTVIGSDPVEMLGGPIIASQVMLKKLGMTIEQMDLYEVNEAFASVPLAWMKCLKADINKLNVNGGAMALGHPLGSTGSKLMGTLLNELERRNLRYGMLSICEGGGMANCTVIERVSNAKL
jgi:acetyl-CoA acetyltransferase family protein